MARSKDYNKRHSANLDRYAGQIGAIFDLLASEAARIGASTGLEDGSAGFSFDRFPLAKKKARALLSKIRKDMQETIESGIRKEWDLSEAKNAALVERLLEGSGLKEDVVRSLQPRNADALEAFVGRKERGLVLSDRVWNITSQAMAEAEAALGLAIGTGKDAQALSRDVRHLLKRPDEMWRRYYVTRTRADGSKVKEAEWRHKVVGQDGKVHFVSEPLSHPGRGVYRSSYRNALRLAVTETNMAYHKADALAWQQSPACIGIEVVLSNNHTSRGVKGLFFDICDELAGRYPKDFTFTGWHPFCRCVAVPLTASREDFVRYLKDKMAGKDVSRVEFPGTIKHMPDNFTKWKEDNKGRIEAMKRKGTLPEFLKERPSKKPNETTCSQWQEMYISQNGGKVSVHPARIAKAHKSKQEGAKFDKEYRMCRTLADNGRAIVMLEEVSGVSSSDIMLDGAKADLKCITGGPGNIVKYIKKALTEQGGEAAVLEIPSHEAKFYEALTEARRKCNGRILFYIKDEKVLKEI